MSMKYQKSIEREWTSVGPQGVENFAAGCLGFLIQYEPELQRDLRSEIKMKTFTFQTFNLVSHSVK